MRREGWTYFAPAATALVLGVFIVTFARERASFRAAVESWATRDLSARTELASSVLREPLATGDFRAIHDFGADCAAEGLRLTIFSGPRGIVYDSQTVGESVPDSLYVTRPSGEYAVRLGLPRVRVLAPFHRARKGFLLAAVLGAGVVLLVFFAIYRQHVRIRELARLEKFRREFIADLSHEIKTPLAGIVGCVDFLADEPALRANDSVSRLLDMLRRETGRMSRLIRQILMLARLEGPSHAQTIEPCDLVGLLAELADRLEPAAERAGSRIVNRATGARIVRCDSSLIAQALENLVTNAIRHAKSPEIRLELREASGGVALVVEDCGVGIPESARAHVFERFYRVDSSRAADTGGSGLGLAIVRQIARRHGGDVTLTPVDPHGARFTLFLPNGV